MKKHIDKISNHEFLVTNGLGGYAFGTIDGPNSRKYHGIYTVSLTPPVKRLHMVSKIAERIQIDGENINLSYENIRQHEETDVFCEQFVHKGTVFQSYAHDNILWSREMAFDYGTNAFAVVYEIEMPKDGFFELTPWFNFRDHHDTETPILESYEGTYDYEEGVFSVSNGIYKLYLMMDGIYTPLQEYSNETYYPIEERRGYPYVERHVILGQFKYPLKQGINRVEIRINLSPEFVSADDIFDRRRARYRMLMDQCGFSHPQIQRLVQASDDFIVYRENTHKKTIIAGYPWFTDWGRDTMIALPGLTLVTGRYGEAAEMIEGFISKAYRGIIPNNFPDEGEEPMYNTSDGTLWLFNAVNEYYKHTHDIVTINKLFPELVDIIEHHIKGTINDIYMDADGLLNTGNEETQLTWMDVKVNGWVVTPRHGKAVEINALWYNAVCILMNLAKVINREDVIRQLELKELSEKIYKSFNEVFWNDKEKRLYDLVIDGKPIDIPRPNMIFAISLENPVLRRDRWESVVSCVEKEFKVPFGLLTLMRNDPDFNGRFYGDMVSRDGAYHRGTAWGWLLGPFLEALYKTHSNRDQILEYLEDSFKHLDEGVHGSYSEIFEGEAPHAQRGCSAQAWSVGEILRIWWLIHNQE